MSPTSRPAAASTCTFRRLTIVTEQQFAERLELLSILFETSGSIELVYFDGMLFGGHHIIVPVGTDGTVGEAWEGRISAT